MEPRRPRARLGRPNGPSSPRRVEERAADGAMGCGARCGDGAPLRGRRCFGAGVGPPRRAERSIAIRAARLARNRGGDPAGHACAPGCLPNRTAPIRLERSAVLRLGPCRGEASRPTQPSRSRMRAWQAAHPTIVPPARDHGPRSGARPRGPRRRRADPTRLPLRTEEQAAQPSRRNPRKHASSSSKPRAERERGGTSAKFSPELAAAAGGVAVRQRCGKARPWPQRNGPLRSHLALLKPTAGRGTRQKGLQ